MTTSPPPPPENIALLIEVLGFDDTLRLIEARGGTKFYIPAGTNNSSDKFRQTLQAEFGEAMTRELIRGFGGGFISVPLCQEWRTALYAHMGMTQSKIALRLGCHADTVSRRLKRRACEDRQSGWAF